MAASGTEVILGLNRYPVFGPLLMYGIGGIFVEVFQDVTFRLAPIGRNEARRMVRQIKGYKLLQGFRGRPKGDIEQIEKCLVGLSNLAINHPEIVELDINPLLVHAEGQGATAADCRMILKGARGGRETGGLKRIEPKAGDRRPAGRHAHRHGPSIFVLLEPEETRTPQPPSTRSFCRSRPRSVSCRRASGSGRSADGRARPWRFRPNGWGSRSGRWRKTPAAPRCPVPAGSGR